MNETCKRIDYAGVRSAVEAEGLERIPGGYRRIVFTNGCFDLLHPGHLLVLMYAKNIAGPHGCVVVGINSDDSVKRLKGESRPIIPELARAQMLLGLRYVDNVVTFYEDTPIELIRNIRPDVIVKGGDYDEKDVVGKDEAIVLTSPYDSTWSTTKIIEMIRKESSR